MARVRTTSRKDHEGLNPWYFVGFADGEGTFHVAFSRRKDLSGGWSIIPEFHVSQQGDREDILIAFQKYLGCGYIKANHARSTDDKTFVLVVRDRVDLAKKVIPFFEQFPLQTAKREDFQRFREIVHLMSRRVHLSEEGFRIVVNLAYSMNRGGRYRRVSKSTILAS